MHAEFLDEDDLPVCEAHGQDAIQDGTDSDLPPKLAGRECWVCEMQVS